MRLRIALFAAVTVALATLLWRREHAEISATAFDTVLLAPQPVAQSELAPAASVSTPADNGDAARLPRSDPERAAPSTSPPPVSAPSIEQIRYWRTRALRGEAYAQCQFARVTQPCAAQNASTAEWAREPLRSDAYLQAVGDHLPNCRGVGDHDTAGTLGSLLRAARSGHTPSQLLFAAGGGLSTLGSIQRPDEVRAFREHASAAAWDAFATGDGDAAVLLWRAYNRVGVEMLLLASVIQPDPVKAHALDQLLLDVVPDHISGSAEEAGLNAVQKQQAAALLRAWRDGAFAQPKPPRYGARLETMLEWDKRAIDLCADDAR